MGPAGNGPEASLRRAARSRKPKPFQSVSADQEAEALRGSSVSNARSRARRYFPTLVSWTRAATSRYGWCEPSVLRKALLRWLLFACSHRSPDHAPPTNQPVLPIGPAPWHMDVCDAFIVADVVV
jgi:hypothetical protein